MPLNSITSNAVRQISEQLASLKPAPPEVKKPYGNATSWMNIPFTGRAPSPRTQELVATLTPGVRRDDLDTFARQLALETRALLPGTLPE